MDNEYDSGFFYKPSGVADEETKKWLPKDFTSKKITHSVKRNIDRKRTSIDYVQKIKDVPLFSWVELNLNELCNRKCPFCPRSGDYPNQNLHMDPGLAAAIAFQLDELNFSGTVNISGTGEPLLTRNLLEIVKCFTSRNINIEIVTNGDRLRPALIKDLYSIGLSQLIVSMYDGPEQIDKFNSLFESCGIKKTEYTLRDRWYSEDEDFGLIYTNRAGAQAELQKSATRPCYYPHYALYIDWNGDVLLCCQDMYNRTVKFGNVSNKPIFDIWRNKRLMDFRKMLKNGKRCESPCSNCNANGLVFGSNHVKQWMI